MQTISIQIHNKLKELNNNIIKVHMRSRLLITMWRYLAANEGNVQTGGGIG